MRKDRRNFLMQAGIASGSIVLSPYVPSVAGAGSTRQSTKNDGGLPYRQIHLDFHTSEHIEGIGQRFDAKRFAETLQKASVNSVTCFGRCHHGYIYYDTRRFPERRHPHLQPGLHLLNEQIDVCHEHGIRVPVYLTIQWDHYTAMRNPEWLMRSPEGEPLGPPYFEPGFYRRLCVNSPYRELIKENIRDLFESVSKVDGLFLDIVGTLECSCRYCREKMSALGLEPSDSAHRRLFATETINEFKHEISALIRETDPDTDIFYNAGHIGPYIRESVDDYSHMEMESLPSGHWGYVHFPLTSRYVRTLNKDYLGMTGKFHTSWGDFYSYKNLPALEYECFMMLAMGAKCSIGDQLPPDGALDDVTYDLIGKVYGKVAEKEKWCVGTTPVVDIAVITTEALHSSSFSGSRTPMAVTGALRMLQESGKQFDIIDFEADYNRYNLLILPDEIVLSSDQEEKLRDYLDKGGKLLATFESGLDDRKSDFVLPLGVRKSGDGPRDIQGNRAVGRIYGRFDYAEYLLPMDNAIGADLPKSEHVMYIKGLPVQALDNGNVTAQTVRSYFDRTYKHFCSHRQTPSSGKISHPAVVATGQTVYFSHPVCTQYQYNAPRWCKTVFINAVDMLLKDQVVRLEAPTTTVCSVMDQKGVYIVHLLHYIPERRGDRFDTIEDIIPIFDVQVSVLYPKSARKVQLVPERKTLDFKTVDGRVEFTVPEVNGHQMIEIS